MNKKNSLEIEYINIVKKAVNIRKYYKKRPDINRGLYYSRLIRKAARIQRIINLAKKRRYENRK